MRTNQSHTAVPALAALALAALAPLALLGCKPATDARAAGSPRGAATQETDEADPRTNQATTNRATANQDEANQNPEENAATRAVAILRAVGDSGVTGSIHFETTEDGLRITGDVRGLEPGEHGFHIHQFGDLTATEDGTSAGGHFAPEGHDHGAPDADQRHVGDLGNIEADGSGNAAVDKVDDVVALTGPHSILGRAVVVHAGKDTFQGKSGEAGDRVAFGVIGIAEAD